MLIIVQRDSRYSYLIIAIFRHHRTTDKMNIFV